MKSLGVHKIYEIGLSKDQKSLKIENTKIKQANGPSLIKLCKDSQIALNKLSIKSCRLKVLPSEVNQLVSLKKLHVEDNKITDIPSIETLEQLEELLLNNNEIQRFQVSISKLLNLKVLDLSINQLGTIPVRLFSMSSLRELYLDNNKFSNFPNHLCELSSLITLSFSENQLKTIPEQIGNMSSLKKLVLAGNLLETIPNSISKIKTLTHLDLSSNSLNQMPQEIGNLVNLKYLYLQHNKLRSIPDDIGFSSQQQQQQQQCNNSSSINNISSSSITNSISDLSISTNINNNNNSNINSGNNSQLTIIRLNNNSITCLPPSIGSLTNLQELYLQENRLITLPNEIERCKFLKKLQLEYNKLTILPESMKTLVNLNVLTLHDNSLSEIPSFLSIDFLHHLIRISIHNNPFLKEEITDSIQYLTNYFTNSSFSNLSTMGASNGGIDTIKEDEFDTPSTSLNSNGLFSVHLNSNSPTGSPVTRSPASSTLYSKMKKDSFANLNLNGSSGIGGLGGSINGLSGNSNNNNINGNGGSNYNGGSIGSGKQSALHKHLLTLSKEFSNDDSDSDSDTCSNSSTNMNVNLFGSNKRSSISPRASLNLSNGMPPLENSSNGNGSHSINIINNNNTGININISGSNGSGSGSGSGSIPNSPNLNHTLRPRRGSGNDSSNSLPGINNISPSNNTSNNVVPTLTRSSSSFLGGVLGRRKSITPSPLSSSGNITPGGTLNSGGLTASTSSSSFFTTPPASPTYKSFQTLYESLLEDLDYSRKRKEELLSLPIEDKWSFLQKIKPDCTTSLIANGVYQLQTQSSSNDIKSLVSSPPKLNSQSLASSNQMVLKSMPTLSIGTPRSPRAHSKVLATHSLFNLDDISKLKSQLQSKPVPWVINFAESSGITAILSMISTFSIKENKIEEDNLIISECLSCLILLVDLGMQSLLLNNTIEVIFPLLLFSNSSIKRLTFEVLHLIAKNFSLGATVILESIKSIQNQTSTILLSASTSISSSLSSLSASPMLSSYNSSTLSQSISNPSLLLSSDSIFSTITKSLEGTYPADIKANCMSLINYLIKCCKSLESRNEIRSEFLKNDILKIIKELRIDGEGIETSSWKLLECEMKAFESSMVEDDNQSSFLQDHYHNNHNNNTTSNYLSDSEDEDTISMMSSSHNTNTSNLQLLTPRNHDFQDDSSPPSNTSSLLLKDSSSCSLTQQFESKIVVLVSMGTEQQIVGNHLAEQQQTKEVTVSILRKSQVCDVIRSLLSSNSNLKELGEWGLYVTDQGVGRFLRDDEYIFDISTRGQSSPTEASPRKNRLSTLFPFKEYRLKMIPWKVRVSLEQVKEMLPKSNTLIQSNNKYQAEEPMDPTMTCSGLVSHLVKKHLPDIDRKYCLDSDDFGLYNSSSSWGAQGSDGYWLEPLEKLHDYEIFKDPKSTVVLKLRPKVVKLKFADGSFEHFRFDLMSPTEKIFQEISEKVVDSSSNNINLSYYGIYIDRQIDEFLIEDKQKRKPEWLEKGFPLYHYRINNRVCLRFAMRPSPVQLFIDESLFKKLQEKEQKLKQQDENEDFSANADEDKLIENNNETVVEQNITNVTTTTTTEANNNNNEQQPPSNGEEGISSILNEFKIDLPLPIKSKQITVQLPLHLPLGEALEIDDTWVDTLIEKSKCSFHLDSFDGIQLNQFQPLNGQSFSFEKNKIYVLQADEEEVNQEQFNHNKVNIWDEQFDSSTYLCDPENPGQIRAATLNKLLECATNNIEKDRELMNILLMTYYSFATSDLLLDKLIERYNVPESEKEQKAVVQLHVIVFLKNWLEQQAPQAASGGGLEEKFLERLSEFVLVLTKDGFHMIVPQLNKWIDSALKEKRAYAMPDVTRTLTLAKLPSLTSSLLDDELFVAQQLTLREYETFKRIQTVEFLNQAWGKPKLQYKAPNLLKMIERFNKISTAVSTAILNQPKLKSRVKLICRFIKITQHLRDLNNYHLLTAFMAGIRNSSVVRLRFSWRKVPKKYLHTLEELEKIMSMEGSFKEFRHRMANSSPPCIPYLGVYLKDLTFIEDGNPDTINSLINWPKKKLIHNIISIIQKCQKYPYDFGPPTTSIQNKADLVLNYFDSLPTAEDEVLYQISLNLEPRM